jgi:hypothetical protein
VTKRKKGARIYNTHQHPHNWTVLSITPNNKTRANLFPSHTKPHFYLYFAYKNAVISTDSFCMSFPPSFPSFFLQYTPLLFKSRHACFQCQLTLPTRAPSFLQYTSSIYILRKNKISINRVSFLAHPFLLRYPLPPLHHCPSSSMACVSLVNARSATWSSDSISPVSLAKYSTYRRVSKNDVERECESNEERER